MAKEYIDRKAVLVATDILDEFLNDSERLYFVKQIKEIPVADVAEVRHGEWLVNTQCNHKPCRMKNPEKWHTYKCSKCGYSNGRRKSNYCPNCGADMRGGKK